MKTAIALLAAAVVIAGSLQLTRAGYSVDEEFTVFAVRGIQSHLVPLLPSGLLYDRGLAYSFASFLITGAQGAQGAQQVLVRARALSVACAALSMILAFMMIKQIAGDAPALLASLLLISSVPFWATATSARFYAPFLAVSMALLLVFSTLRTLCTSRTLCTIAALGLLARTLHELSFLAAAVPAVCFLASRGDRRRWFYATCAVVAGLLMGQFLLLAIHALQPANGETMVRRFFLWQVLNLFERPGDRQFMIPVVVMALAWIVAPTRARTVSVIALSIAAMVLAYAIARASNSAPLSRALVGAVVVEGSRYPLDMLWHILRATPLTLLVALAGLVARVARLGGEWTPGERAIHLLWIGWVLWFGVIDSGITTNYLLLPMTFMLIAIALDLHAVRRCNFSPSRPAASMALMALVVAALVGDQWRGAGSLAAKLDQARPTIVGLGIEEIRDGLQANDRVVCTDELGCMMLVGRIDRWLALDDYVRERFLVRRGDAPIAGVYTGAPAVFRPSELFEPNADGTLPARVLIVDIFKEYPIGNSRSWLPKAIEGDHVQVRPLLETTQLRVLEISPPERVARQ